MKKIILMLTAIVLLFSGCDIHTTEIVKPGVDMFTDYIDANKAD
jgi:PBP1b-binding outer membrane lipoprotein LpoB